MSLFVGQVPAQPMLILVDDGGQPADLSIYDSVTVRMIDPNGSPVDMSAGTIEITNPGQVKYLWPAVSLFTTPGDYRVQLSCSEGNIVLDFTSVGVIEVYQPLQELPEGSTVE